MKNLSLEEFKTELTTNMLSLFGLNPDDYIDAEALADWHGQDPTDAGVQDAIDYYETKYNLERLDSFDIDNSPAVLPPNPTPDTVRGHRARKYEDGDIHMHQSR